MANRRPTLARRRSSRARASAATFNSGRLKEEVDTYVDAIYAVLALVNHARWDDGTRSFRSDLRFGIGRRFSCLKNAERTLTPDAAVQLNSTLGLIAEAKPGVARSQTIWQHNIDQLSKYDDDLIGWWTPDERIKSHDVVALLPLPRVADFIDLLQERVKSGRLSFSRPVVVVGFVKNTGAEKTWVILQSQQASLGSLRDGVLREKLRRAVPIDWQLLLTHYRDIRFIDAEPPLPYTLYVLWDLVLTRKAAGRQPEAGENWIAVDVDVQDLTQEIQDYFGFKSDGARAVQIPRLKWIRRALDALVVFGMATRISEQMFRVKYRRYRTRDRDTVTFFGRLVFKHRERLARAEAARPLLDIAMGQATLGSESDGGPASAPGV